MSLPHQFWKLKVWLWLSSTSIDYRLDFCTAMDFCTARAYIFITFTIVSHCRIVVNYFCYGCLPFSVCLFTNVNLWSLSTFRMLLRIYRKTHKSRSTCTASIQVKSIWPYKELPTITILILFAICLRMWGPQIPPRGLGCGCNVFFLTRCKMWTYTWFVVIRDRSGRLVRDSLLRQM